MKGITLPTRGLLNFNETRKKLGIGQTTVFRWIKSGKLHPYKIGKEIYFGEHEVDSLAENGSGKK